CLMSALSIKPCVVFKLPDFPHSPVLGCGLGTDEDTLIEILASRNNREIREIKKAYKDEFKKDLESDITSDTKGDFRNALLALAKVHPCVTTYVHSYRHCDSRACLSAFFEKSVFDQYSKYSKVDVGKAIDLELKGDIENCLVAVVKCAGSKPAYFAEKLNLAMKGSGCREKILTRILVSRSEVDLVQIKQEYKKKYGKTLYKDILVGSDQWWERLITTLKLHEARIGTFFFIGEVHQRETDNTKISLCSQCPYISNNLQCCTK
uniref:Annexin n=1 Tax=Astyanax mexicanus TaxID=7994 RepID=A0A8B9JC94_ASTMX